MKYTVLQGQKQEWYIIKTPVNLTHTVAGYLFKYVKMCCIGLTMKRWVAFI